MTMSVIQGHRHEAGTTVAAAASHTESRHDRSPWFARALATLRIAFGITFLWAFLDKLLALGFHTGYDQEGNLDRFGDAAWINGASPTEGFLSFAIPEDNPFKGFFNGLAGSAVVDWLFMMGLLGIGVTLLLGVGMRIGTAAGAAMYAFMYAASLPLENNPVVDDHLIGIIVMVVLALAAAGRTWGLGRWWESLDIVRKNPVLR
jgi:thiosulfate dehydrogenase [quinone] large subunit